jgi:fructose-1,6-bisphosphatase/inositol monophosphatase family enzyme
MTPSMPRHDRFFDELFARYDRVTVPAYGRVAAQAKADGSAVTAADRDASALVLDALKRHTPGYGVISEEEDTPYLPGASWRWAVDPLDGTAAFARGLPVWGVGIGLLREAQPREGYLHFPLLAESYAFRDGVALRNGEPIEPPSSESAADCRNVMITAVHSHVDVRRVAGFRLHNLGSNLYHMLALATGRCEAIISGPCYLWDLAPALPFTRAIGHVERFLDGSPLVIEDLLSRADFGFPVPQPLIVGAPAVVAALLEMLSDHQQV